MKKHSLIVSVLLSLSFLYTSHVKAVTKNSSEQALDNITRRVTQGRTGRADAVNRLLQSPQSLAATLTAFAGDNRFFLAGAKTETTKTLARAFVANDATGQPVVQFQPMAPDFQVRLNEIFAEQSPLNSREITTLTLAGEDRRPAVTTMDFDPDAEDTSVIYPHTYLVKNDEGTVLLGQIPSFDSDTNFILDAKGTKVTVPPVALAATGSTDGELIAVAVPENGQSWGFNSNNDDTFTPADDARAISVLQINDNEMVQDIDVLSVNDGGSAPVSAIAGNDLRPFQDRLTEAGPLAFFSPRDQNLDSRAFLGNKVAMHWDDQLQRLYIALTDLTRGDTEANPNQTPNSSAGVCSVLVGRFKGEQSNGELARGGENFGEGEGEGGGGPIGSIGLDLSPVIKNACSYLFPEVQTHDSGDTLGDPSKPTENFAEKYILGFYRSSTQNIQKDWLFATARNIRTMHTSTGKTYLIVNGGVGASFDGLTPPFSTNVQVYAIPLVDKGPEDQATGFVARNDDCSKVIDLQPIIDQALLNAGDDDVVAADELFSVYNDDGNTTTYDVSGTDVSDITDQKSFRTFIKNAMPLSSNPAQRVGGIEDPQTFNRLLSFDGSADIRDVFVYGDTVYIAVASFRDFEHIGEAGIFASTALFESTGEVRAWTPWQRVMGNTDATYGMGFDGESSNFWYFTTDGGAPAENPTIVNRTQWGLGDPALHDNNASAMLSSIISELFPASEGGVFGLFSFGPDTPGFKVRDPSSPFFERRHEQFSMMVATGLRRVAIIEMGSRLRSQTGAFARTTAFTTFIQDSGNEEVATVYLFQADSQDDIGKALENLGAITTAEVSRLPLRFDSSREGWLFVGGETGVAVLVEGYDGHGWPTAENLGVEAVLPGTTLTIPGSSSTDFPGGRRWFFVQLVQETPTGSFNPFIDVRKLVSDGDKYLYILTGSQLFRIAMTNVNFTVDRNSNKLEARIPAANIERVASMFESKKADTGLQVSLGNTTDELYDMMVIKRDKTEGVEKSTLLLATSQGVFVTDEVTDIPKTPGTISWKPVKTSLDTVLGPSILLDFASSERGQKMVVRDNTLCARGNVTVTAFDPFLTHLSSYRFDIDNGEIKPFVEPYGTDYFYKIGNLLNPGNTQSNQLPAHDAFYARSAGIPGSGIGFTDRVPVRPVPQSFLKNKETDFFEPINLGFPIQLPLQAARPIKDHASGSDYFYGAFGVRVNE